MDIVHKYNTTAEELDTLPPHVYGIGQQAFASLSSERMTQFILISGESGAENGNDESFTIFSRSSR